MSSIEEKKMEQENIEIPQKLFSLEWILNTFVLEDFEK